MSQTITNLTNMTPQKPAVKIDTIGELLRKKKYQLSQTPVSSQEYIDLSNDIRELERDDKIDRGTLSEFIREGTRVRVLLTNRTS